MPPTPPQQKKQKIVSLTSIKDEPNECLRQMLLGRIPQGDMETQRENHIDITKQLCTIVGLVWKFRHSTILRFVALAMVFMTDPG